MKSSNDITLQAYEEHVQEYIEGTPKDVDQADGKLKQWIDENLDMLKHDATIIEIGSAFGKTANYIESKGFKVERTDAAKGFVDYMKEQGKLAKTFNLIKDRFTHPYDMVYAEAVLLHFTRKETREAVSKIFDALKDDGRFVFSLKIGEGEGWKEHKLGVKRYFCFWQPAEIENVLKDAGFKSIKIDIMPDYRGDGGPKWLLISATKEQVA